MQAIRTRYLSATDTKPSRMQAKCEAGTLVVSYDYELDLQGNHEQVAKQLSIKLDWRLGAAGCFAGDYYHPAIRNTL